MLWFYLVHQIFGLEIAVSFNFRTWPTPKPVSRKRSPWTKSELKRKSRKKHGLYCKAKASRNREKMEQIKAFKKQFSRDCKKSRAEHNNRSVIGGLVEGNSKPFWRFVKSLRQDNIGVPPLKRHGKLFSGAAEKARIMLEKFKSVFTIEGKTFIPWLGPSKPTMHILQIHSAGVLKLLNQLKPDKAAGSDHIPDQVLKELINELAPQFTVS